MAIAVLMRRVSPEDVARGLEHLESGFGATMDDDVFAAEAAAGLLCSLGRDWAFVDLALTGDRHTSGTLADLVVLGGDPLGQAGPADRDMIILLDVEKTAVAAAYLGDIDPDALLEQRRPQLSERVGGVLSDEFLAGVRQHLENLRAFYTAAAKAGQAVAKRTYL
ncbi:DUF1877 family protein [Actinoplanes sp. NPDC048796]|uniref:DUF1877 family protein n=1 Tax=Actinoplanes sp. NPDC048796 TaxID=3155640 RepID=UPI0033FEEEAD